MPDDNGNHVNVGGMRFQKEQLAAWIFRLIVIIGFLWLHNNFVTKADYKSDALIAVAESKERTDILNKINTRLEVMDERMKSDDTHRRVEKLEEWFHAIDKRIPDKPQP